MGDKCVVCGEAEEGKPLYKKLGDGEHNVEVITALQALCIISLPDSARDSSYICWDCDEIIVEQYGRHVEETAQKAVALKQARKQHQRPRKKKNNDMKMKVKVASNDVSDGGGMWVVQQVNPPPPPRQKAKRVNAVTTKSTLKKMTGTGRAYHTNHCLLCGSNFESESRGYLKYSLKKAVSDDMDVAQVMMALGQAKHIEPHMKSRRFVCNPCYVILRRNYKDKLQKGTTVEGPTPSLPLLHQDPIHRATTEEHAAEIARLLPPALAECYKILTSNPQPLPPPPQPPPAVTPEQPHHSYQSYTHSYSAPTLGSHTPASEPPSTPLRAGTTKKGVRKPRAMRLESGGKKLGRKKAGTKSSKSVARSNGLPEDSEGEEEDENVNLSRDDDGNYFINVMSPSDGSKGRKVMEGKAMAHSTPITHKKKNVLLPKRLHHHLSGNGLDPTDATTETSGAGRESVKVSPVQPDNQEILENGTCNICGISFSGKTRDWWRSLTSHLVGFDSITINMALKVLDTQLTYTSDAVRAAQQVCLPCYSKVSAGFRSQVVQKFARSRNMSTSDIDLSRVKVRMLPKQPKPANKKQTPSPTIRQSAPLDDTEDGNSDEDSDDSALETDTDVDGKIAAGMTSDSDYAPSVGEPKVAKKKNYRKNGGIHSTGMKRKCFEDGLTIKKLKGTMKSDMQLVKYNRLHGRVGGSKFTTSSVLFDKKRRGRPRKPIPSEGLVPNIKRPPGRPRKMILGPGRPRKRLRSEDECSPVDTTERSRDESSPDESSPKGSAKRSREETNKPVVVLKDLKFVLPREVFGGKAVSALSIEENMTHEEPADQPPSPSAMSSTSAASPKKVPLDLVPQTPGAGASPLQFIFNALSTYQRPHAEIARESQASCDDEDEDEDEDEDDEEGLFRMCGRCVVCGVNHNVRRSFWHTVRDNIGPPTLMVPVEWVCVSLGVPRPTVSTKERDIGKVCGQCYVNLGQRFQLFVKSKVGESCGLEADDVDLSEYLITFNPTTMNLEADPKQQSYIHEFEDGGELLMHLFPVLQQFSVDQLVSEGARQPLQPHQYNVWLLLLLNELRTQVGAALGELGHWLVSLMPSQMYDSGLRPLSTALAAYLLSITRARASISEEELNSPIPSTLFEIEASQVPPRSTSPSGTLPAKTWASGLGEEDDKVLPWEEYLEHINLDSMMNGTAQPIPAEHLTQGLVYAVWQVSRLLAEGDQLVVDWITKLSPVNLTHDHIQSLVSSVGSLQSRLENNPEDAEQLKDQVLPLLKARFPNLSLKPKTIKETSLTPKTIKETRPLEDSSMAIIVEELAITKAERKAMKKRGEDAWNPGSYVGRSVKEIKGQKRKLRSTGKQRNRSGHGGGGGLNSTTTPTTATLPTPLAEQIPGTILSPTPLASADTTTTGSAPWTIADTTITFIPPLTSATTTTTNSTLLTTGSNTISMMPITSLSPTTTTTTTSTTTTPICVNPTITSQTSTTTTPTSKDPATNASTTPLATATTTITTTQNSSTTTTTVSSTTTTDTPLSPLVSATTTATIVPPDTSTTVPSICTKVTTTESIATTTTTIPHNPSNETTLTTSTATSTLTTLPQSSTTISTTPLTTTTTSTTPLTITTTSTMPLTTTSTTPLTTTSTTPLTTTTTTLSTSPTTTTTSTTPLTTIATTISTSPTTALTPRADSPTTPMTTVAHSPAITTTTTTLDKSTPATTEEGSKPKSPSTNTESDKSTSISQTNSEKPAIISSSSPTPTSVSNLEINSKKLTTTKKSQSESSSENSSNKDLPPTDSPEELKSSVAPCNETRVATTPESTVISSNSACKENGLDRDVDSMCKSIQKEIDNSNISIVRDDTKNGCEPLDNRDSNKAYSDDSETIKDPTEGHTVTNIPKENNTCDTLKETKKSTSILEGSSDLSESAKNDHRHSVNKSSEKNHSKRKPEESTKSADNPGGAPISKRVKQEKDHDDPSNGIGTTSQSTTHTDSKVSSPATDHSHVNNDRGDEGSRPSSRVRRHSSKERRKSKSRTPPLSKDEVQRSCKGTKKDQHDETNTNKDHSSIGKEKSSGKSTPTLVNTGKDRISIENEKSCERALPVKDQPAKSETEKAKERNHDDPSKDTACMDYVRESEAVQVSSKLFSKVKELESELEEIKRHNKKLQQDNHKLSGVHSPELLQHNQEEQTNKTLNHVKDQLKTMMSKSATTPRANKSNDHSPRSSSPPHKIQDSKKSNHAEKTIHRDSDNKKEHSIKNSNKDLSFTDAPQSSDSVTPVKDKSLLETKKTPHSLSSLHKQKVITPVNDELSSSSQSPKDTVSTNNVPKQNNKKLNRNNLNNSSHHELAINHGKISLISPKKTETKAEIQVLPSEDKPSLVKPVRPQGNSSHPAASRVMLVQKQKNQSPFKPHELGAKKPKPSFEALMNYDIKGRAPK